MSISCRVEIIMKKTESLRLAFRFEKSLIEACKSFKAREDILKLTILLNVSSVWMKRLAKFGE